MKTIYNVYVELNNDHDRYLRLMESCKNAGLPTDEKPVSKKNKEQLFKTFHNNRTESFGDWCEPLPYQKKATESEFIELLKEYKNAEKTNS